VPNSFAKQNDHTFPLQLPTLHCRYSSKATVGFVMPKQKLSKKKIAISGYLYYVHMHLILDNAGTWPHNLSIITVVLYLYGKCLKALSVSYLIVVVTELMYR